MSGLADPFFLIALLTVESLVGGWTKWKTRSDGAAGCLETGDCAEEEDRDLFLWVGRPPDPLPLGVWAVEGQQCRGLWGQWRQR